MRTPKIKALHRLIDWLNNKFFYNVVKLPPKLDLDKVITTSHAWLTGFIESDGNFYCGFNLNPKGGIAKIVKCYMRISPKKSYILNSGWKPQL